MDERTQAPEPDYKELYTSLFNELTDVIGALNSIETVAGNARRRLMKAQQAAEEHIVEK